VQIEQRLEVTRARQRLGVLDAAHLRRGPSQPGRDLVADHPGAFPESAELPPQTTMAKGRTTALGHPDLPPPGSEVRCRTTTLSAEIRGIACNLHGQIRGKA